MLLLGLRTLFRREANDATKPYLWSDEALNDFANEAEQEACRRGHLLIDSTANFCTIPIVAGDDVLALDPRIIDVRRARLIGENCMLDLIHVDEMDASAPQWETETGTPRALVTDYQSNALRLYPIPTAADSLKLTVSRLPMKDMAADDDAPEIRIEHRRGLVQWMLHRAFDTKDSELIDPQGAAKALAKFEAEFGRRSSARNEHWMRERMQMTANPIA